MVLKSGGVPASDGETMFQLPAKLRIKVSSCRRGMNVKLVRKTLDTALSGGRSGLKSIPCLIHTCITQPLVSTSKTTEKLQDGRHMAGNSFALSQAKDDKFFPS
jgi:hypothetical protein